MELSISPTTLPDMIRITGKERVKSINNLCTQDIAKATPGQVLEAFITNPQGKTIGFCRVCMMPDEILLVTSPGGFTEAIPHLQKYSIFDDATYEILSGKMESVSLPDTDGVRNFVASTFKSSDAAAAEQPACVRGTFAEIQQVYLIRQNTPDFQRIEWIGPAGIASQLVEQLKNQLGQAPSVISDAEMNLHRILAGVPIFGIDIKNDQLPQEVDRNTTAINFNKGCYLGQETVARLDALGHVNRQLMRVEITDTNGTDFQKLPLPIQIVNDKEQSVGEIRSLAYNPGTSACCGLALVRIKALDGPLHIADSPNAKLQFKRISERS